MNDLFGIKVISSPLVPGHRTVYRVERHPIKKRRRQWHVVKRQEPVAYMIDMAAAGLGGGQMIGLNPAHMAMLVNFKE